MSKILKVLSLIITIAGIIFYSNYSYALNMNLENNTSNNSLNSIANNNTTVSSNNSNETGSSSTKITVNTEELRISNLLSICLIAVGIVIIFLAFAILIKLKK